ncbi:MAG: hypothetical protein AAB267_04865 [Candidatus Desantisbacteria bacterium]
MNTEGNEKRKRLTIDLSERAYKELEDTMKDMDATTMAETIRRAVGLANFLVGEKRRGVRIFIKSDKETREIVAI